jgi:uncharacterized DUF497 family protein
MKHKYIVNFSTTEDRNERRAIMIAETEQEATSTLIEEFEDLGQELKIISIRESNPTPNFVLDF